MRASLRWLEQSLPSPLGAERCAELLTAAGLEVEAIEATAGSACDARLATICELVPLAEQGARVTLELEAQRFSVVARSAEGLALGGRVAFVAPGTRLNARTRIEARKVRGERSEGMICSAADLGLAEQSTQALQLEGPEGLRVAELLELEDTVLELSITPNRADALGHRGLLRDLAAMLRLEPELRTEAPLPEGLATVSVAIEARGGSERYTALHLCDLTWPDAGTPWALRARLASLGVRAIDPVVDATNLCMLDWGHPIHAFDAATLSGPLRVRQAKPGERLTLLDGTTLSLSGFELVIADDAGPQALAGIMGGAASQVRSETRELLVEAAHFDPSLVRRAAKHHGLQTEASHRFERGLGAAHLPQLLESFRGWLEACGARARVAGLGDQDLRPARAAIPLREARFAHLMGRPVPMATQRAHLRALGCTVSVEGATAQVTPPDTRRDLQREADLIEEVARLEGIDSFEAAFPSLHAPGRQAPDVAAEAEISARLVASGLQELTNFVFPRDELVEACGYVRETLVRLDNPLTDARTVLRPSLTPGLLDVAMQAQRRQQLDLRLFELGRCFQPGAQGALRQGSMLALLLAGQRQPWLEGSEALDFFDLKAAVMQALGLGADALRWSTDAAVPTWLHPRLAANLSLGETPIGVVGALHPRLRRQLDLRGPVWIAELDLDRWLQVAPRAAAVASEPPRFPATERDMALWVPTTLSAGALQAALEAQGGPLLERTQLFDRYADEQDAQVSLAFRFTYRHNERTLRDAEVEESLAAIQAAAESLGATRR